MTPLTSGMAFDPTALNALKARSGGNDRAALREAARQFEAIMLTQMMKSMREASASGGVLESQDGRLFQGLLDEQWASGAAKGQGLGIARMIEKQLAMAQGISGADSEELPLPTDRLAPAIAASLRSATQRQALPQATASVAATGRDLPAGKSAFVETLLPQAAPAAEQLGVAPELIVGHAALESGWGRSPIRTADGQNSHNLFGIKAGRSWKGAVAESMTTEYENGVPQRRVERFRAYGSYAEAFADYAQLLASKQRFSAALGQGRDASAFAQALQQGGYATDPHYARKLTQVASELL